MEVKRTERGWAGHFCCSYRCEYHRNTLLEYNGMKVVVSTVGRLRKGRTRIKYMEVGHGRYFETRAFIANENDKYNNADVTKEVVFNAKWDLPSPDMVLEADAMHEDVVTELSKRLVDGTLIFGNIKQQTAQRINIMLRQLYDIKTENEKTENEKSDVTRADIALRNRRD